MADLSEVSRAAALRLCRSCRNVPMKQLDIKTAPSKKPRFLSWTEDLECPMCKSTERKAIPTNYLKVMR